MSYMSDLSVPRMQAVGDLGHVPGTLWRALITAMVDIRRLLSLPEPLRRMTRHPPTSSEASKVQGGMQPLSQVPQF